MNRQFGLILFFLCLAAALYAGGGMEKNDIIQVTGRVRLVGNEPFSELVITSEGNSWYIAKNDAHKLHDLQHRMVTVTGEETVMELTFANGRPAGQRRTLNNITIIAVDY